MMTFSAPVRFYPSLLFVAVICALPTWLPAQETTAPPRSTSGTAGPATPGAPRLLPEDTLAYFRIENVAQFRNDLASSPAGRMMADPKLKPLASDMYAMAAELFESLGKQFDVTLDEVLGCVEGQFAVGLFLKPSLTGEVADAATGPKDESPEAIRERLAARSSDLRPPFQAVLVVETGAADATLTKILEGIETKLKSSGAVSRTTTTGGVAIVKFIRNDRPEQTIEYFQRDGLTLIGVGEGVAEAALQRWNGESTSRTLAESTDFAAVMTRCLGAEDAMPQITFFVNPYRIVQRLIRGSEGGAAFVWPIVDSLGIAKIRGFGGSVFQGGESFSDISHMHVLLDPPRDGIFGVVRPTEGDTNPPAWIPEDVSGYVSVNWRTDKTFDGFERIFDRFSGDGQFATRVIDRFKERTGMDLRESIVNVTKDRFAMITWLQTPATFNSECRVFAVQLKDPVAFEETLRELHKTIAKRDVPENVGGVTVYARPPRDREAPANFRAAEPCHAVVGDWFLFSDSRNLLDRCIRANSGAIPQLANQPDYDLVASELGAQLDTEKPFLISFSRDSERLRQLYEMAKADKMREFARTQENNPFMKRLAEMLDRNELPPFDDFKKYFAPSGTFGYDEPNGIHFGRYTLKSDL